MAIKVEKLGIAIISCVATLIIGFLIFTQAVGWRFFVVVSPSMGETAPVGSLVITETAEKYQKNDIVAFYNGPRVYTHRIVGVDEKGFITRGDLNAVNDAMRLKDEQIIGKAIYIKKYLGWVWRAMPFLIIGFLIVYLVSCLKKVKEPWRWPVRIVGWSLVVILTTFFLNPWLRVDGLGYGVPDKEKGMSINVVNTGVFPIKDDDGNRFYVGQTRFVHTKEINDKGHYVYMPRPSLGPIGLLIAAIWCLMPLFIALLVKLPPPDIQSARARIHDRRVNTILFFLSLSMTVLILALQLSTLAATPVVIENTTNSRKMNRYFSCNEAQGVNAVPRPVFAYAIQNNGSSEPDISGNNNAGSYAPGSAVGLVVGASPFGLGCRYNTYSGGWNQYNQVANFDPSQGTGYCLVESTKYTNPQTFSLEVWFKTTEQPGGTIMGFADNKKADVLKKGIDRLLYINTSGQLVFGILNGSTPLTIQSTADYADGVWHHAVATLSQTDGMRLYVDGIRVAENAQYKTPQNAKGYWRVGCGKANNDNIWPGVGNRNYFFKGQLQHAAGYDVALTDDQVMEHFIADGGTRP